MSVNDSPDGLASALSDRHRGESELGAGAWPRSTSLRIEVSSSNFPRFDRNLNTGGNNYDETEGVVAHQVVHHSAEYPSRITVMVVTRQRLETTGSR